MTANEQLSLIADELRAIANMGLYRTENIHDRERYEKTLSLSAQIVSTLSQHKTDEILDIYREHMVHVCPFLGVATQLLCRRPHIRVRYPRPLIW